MMSDIASDVEDERQVELASIAAIFPEIVLDVHDSFKAFLHIPVTPSTPQPVAFLVPSDEASSAVPAPAQQAARPETYLISHLPHLRLEILLPTDYPFRSPPSFKLSTVPRWLPRTVLDQLEADGERLWDELGRDQTIFAYIDYLQQRSEDLFGLLNDREYLEVPQHHKASLLGFNINAKRAIFERETFYCGICLDPKKGSTCHQMLDCGHVFCQDCLQTFYNNAINEGDIVSVKCLEPNCAKTRSNSESLLTGKHRKRKTNISPDELLQIPLKQEMVKRYMRLKRKVEVESDQNTVYCPRRWCQGAARSNANPPPSNNVKDSEKSDSEKSIDKEVYNITKTTTELILEDLLCVCEDCSFAFCRRCYHSWHGTFELCIPRLNTGELKEEDKASLEYLRLHSTACPTCAAPAQKTHGCNHMICFRCNCHFCYLCAAWLDPEDPYEHFNDEVIGCFERLWELEAGDGDDVGIGFAGGFDMQDGDGGEEELIDLQVEEIGRRHE